MAQKHVLILLTNFSLTGSGVYSLCKWGLKDNIDFICVALSPKRFNADPFTTIYTIRKVLGEKYPKGDVQPLVLCYDMAVSKSFIEEDEIGKAIPTAYSIYFDTYDSVDTKGKYFRLEYMGWAAKILSKLSPLFNSDALDDNKRNFLNIIGMYNSGANNPDVFKLNSIFWNINTAGVYSKTVPSKFDMFHERFKSGFSGYYRKTDEDMISANNAKTFTQYREADIMYRVFERDGRKYVFGLFYSEDQNVDVALLANHFISGGMSGIFIAIPTGVYLTTNEPIDVFSVIGKEFTVFYKSPTRYTLDSSSDLLEFLSSFTSETKNA